MHPAAGGNEWASWSRESFALAAARGRPVLLLLTTRWSEACARFERDLREHADLASAIARRFVPVKVDADERPDIAERYTLGGWPTVAWLTPSGALLGGGPVSDLDRFAGALVGVADAFARARDRLADAHPAAEFPFQPDPLGTRRPPALTAPSEMARQVIAQFDHEHGGFGTGPKRLQGAVLEFAALEAERGGEARLAGVVRMTLDAAIVGRLRDESGGYFRVCHGRDWTRPERALLLEVQAEALRAFGAAWRVFGEPRDRDQLVTLTRYVTGRLRMDGGGFALFDAGLTPRPSPAAASPGSMALLVDANARAAGALLATGALLGDQSPIDAAIECLERLASEAYAPGDGVAHVAGPRPRVRGLLRDQVAFSAALLDAADVAGGPAYADLADELMRTAIRRLWDPQRLAFLDRDPAGDDDGGLGLVACPLTPLATNCEAATVIERLAAVRDDASLRALADVVLGAFSGAWPGAGLDGAPYALAIQERARLRLG